MSLDTKYRPRVYSDVVGQESTTKILKNIVKSGSRYHQSYLFSGPWGSGKTTLARILARVLLCPLPVDGEPCDTCPSCLNMLSGNSPDFVEVDAANNSGKEDMKKVLEEIEYSSFSGNRKVYLFDEAHALTKGSLDSLLLPLENTLKGSDDKKLVCIFCTTEPEKMRATVLSRCAPNFVVQPSTIEDITARLKFVSKQENIVAEEQALSLIAQFTDKHIRDALKVLESISASGDITIDTTKAYLKLDNLDRYYRMILNLKSDIDISLTILEDVLQTDSPSSVYTKLVDIFLYSYKINVLGSKIPAYYDLSRLKEINVNYGRTLLDFASYLSGKLYNPTKITLTCDLYALVSHNFNQSNNNLTNLSIKPDLSGKSNKEALSASTNPLETQKLAPTVPITTHAKVTQDGVYVNPRAINTNRSNSVVQTQSSIKESAEMEPHDFKWLLKLKLAELGIHGNRKT